MNDHMNDIDETRDDLARRQYLHDCDQVRTKTTPTKIVINKGLAKSDPFEFLSTLHHALNAENAETRLALLRSHRKSIVMALNYIPQDESPRALDAMKSLYETVQGKVRRGIVTVGDKHLKPFFDRAMHQTETMTDFELDVADYLDLLTPATKSSFLKENVEKVTNFIENCLNTRTARSIRLVNHLRFAFGDVPPAVDKLCQDFMAGMAAELTELATLKKQEGKEKLCSNIDLVMTATPDWRPTAESQDHLTETKLVVIFNDRRVSGEKHYPEMWALMSMTEQKIFAAAHAPDEIMSYLSTQMTEDNLPTVESLAPEIPYLRGSRVALAL